MTIKKIFSWVLGFALIVSGIVLVLLFWADVAALFRGVIGALVAIAGLVVMSLARD